MEHPVVNGATLLVTVGAAAATAAVYTPGDILLVVTGVVTVLTPAIVAVITALRINTKLTEVHTLVNKNFSEQSTEIAHLLEVIKGLHEIAKTKDEASKAMIVEKDKQIPGIVAP